MIGQVEQMPQVISESEIQGLLQGRVGIFLQLKSKLQEMSRSPILTISDKANQLLTTQNQLETELPTAVSSVSEGSFTDIISAGGFYFFMEKQISDTNDLYDQYTGLGESAKASLISGIPNWLLFIGISGLVILKARRRKK